jgi:hypothetical protein
MAIFGPTRRPLLYGIIVGASIFAATASGTSAIERPAPFVGFGASFHGQGRGGLEALLQRLHRGRFCTWYPRHRLCFVPVGLRRFCDRHPDHHLCDDDNDDPFCRRHPNHRRCDDKPPSPS